MYDYGKKDKTIEKMKRKPYDLKSRTIIYLAVIVVLMVILNSVLVRKINLYKRDATIQTGQIRSLEKQVETAREIKFNLQDQLDECRIQLEKVLPDINVTIIGGAE